MLLSSFACAQQAPWDKLSGQSLGIKEKLLIVVRSDKQWGDLWQRHCGKADGQPAVDFRREMVVAVFLGEQPAAGVQVDATVLADPIEPKSRLVVFYREITSAIKPDSEASKPFVMVKVPVKPKVDFEEDGQVTMQGKPPVQQSALSPERQQQIQQSLDRLRSLSADPQFFK